MHISEKIYLFQVNKLKYDLLFLKKYHAQSGRILIKVLYLSSLEKARTVDPRIVNALTVSPTGQSLYMVKLKNNMYSL